MHSNGAPTDGRTRWDEMTGIKRRTTSSSRSLFAHHLSRRRNEQGGKSSSIQLETLSLSLFPLLDCINLCFFDLKRRRIYVPYKGEEKRRGEKRRWTPTEMKRRRRFAVSSIYQTPATLAASFSSKSLVSSLSLFHFTKETAKYAVNH